MDSIAHSAFNGEGMKISTNEAKNILSPRKG